MTLPPEAQAETERWAAQYAAAYASMEAASGAASWAAFQQVTDWYDSAQTISAAKDAAGTIAALRDQIAGLAAQFIATIDAIVGGSRVPSIAAPSVGLPRNADPFDVWSRPVWAYRDTVARGGTEADAFVAARLRSDLLAETESILAKRSATAVVMEQQQISHYRRVIRPEMSKGGSCGLCVVASSRIYSVEDLLPIHERCACDVMPIVGSNDPGRTMNADDMAALFADAGSKKSADLKRTRYRVDEHGELGPVLEYASKPPRGSATSPANSTERAAKELAALLPVLESLESRAAAGQDVSGPLGYQRDRIAQLRGLVDAA